MRPCRASANESVLPLEKGCADSLKFGAFGKQIFFAASVAARAEAGGTASGHSQRCSGSVLTLEDGCEVVVDRAHLESIQNPEDSVVYGRVQSVYVYFTAGALVCCTPAVIRSHLAALRYGETSSHSSP